MLEKILHIQNLNKAFERIESKKGLAGVVKMQTDELRKFVYDRWKDFKRSIMTGSYRASPVRKVEIPKPGGEKGCWEYPR
jgi:retron-type reverse transcriptase